MIPSLLDLRKWTPSMSRSCTVTESITTPLAPSAMMPFWPPVTVMPFTVQYEAPLRWSP